MLDLFPTLITADEQRINLGPTLGIHLIKAPDISVVPLLRTPPRPPIKFRNLSVEQYRRQCLISGEAKNVSQETISLRDIQYEIRDGGLTIGEGRLLVRAYLKPNYCIRFSGRVPISKRLGPSSGLLIRGYRLCPVMIVSATQY